MGRNNTIGEKLCRFYDFNQQQLYGPNADIKSKERVVIPFHAEILNKFEAASNRSQLVFGDIRIEKSEFPRYQPFRLE